MRNIKVNQIKSVLDEYSSRLSNGKVYSVLFVSEDDNYVKCMIEEWLEEQKERGFTYSLRSPEYFYDEDPQGFLRKTNYYGYFDQANIVFDNIESGYGKDDTYKNEYVDAFLNLKNKEGKYPNKDVQLIIIRTLNPAWVGNEPLFSINDTTLFDEIVNVEVDKEVFEEMYLGKIESRINKCKERIKNGDPSVTIEKLESWLNEEKNRYDLAKFVLDHARFDFVPLKRLEGVYDSVTGTATDGFSPVTFCNIFGHISTADDFQESCDGYGLREKYKRILLEIINEYKNR
jgi:hypothetical protein